MSEAVCVWPARASLGESPCWDDRSEQLVWVDIRSAELHAYRPDLGEHQTWNLPGRICSLDVPSSDWRAPEVLCDERFIGCGDQGLSWIGIDDDAVDIIPIANPELNHARNRFNDGKMGPDGRYWAGTMDEAEELATGHLYAFRADGSYIVLDDGYRVANGPAFSPDGSTVYHADSARQLINVLDLEADGTLANKRTFVQFAEGEGYPDGMTADLDGNLWVAMWDGSRIEVISPNGERIEEIPIPTPRPTSCTFTHPNCRELYVTSASIGVANHPFAGGLFRVHLG